MYEYKERIEFLENIVNERKRELRRIKTTINKVEKLGLIPPTELLIKKEEIEVELKEFKQELKLYKKIDEIIK